MGLRRRTHRARHAADRPVASGIVGNKRLRPSGLEHVGDGGAVDRPQHSVGRRTLAVVFAVRTGLGRRRNRPGRRLFHRDVESRKFRRCRHVGPLPRASADAGAYSRGASGAGKPPSRNAANPPPAGPATAAAAERRLGAALHPGHDTRNKVRKIPPDRCNFGRRAAYLKADHHFRVAWRPS